MGTPAPGWFFTRALTDYWGVEVSLYFDGPLHPSLVLGLGRFYLAAGRRKAEPEPEELLDHEWAISGDDYIGQITWTADPDGLR